MSLIPLISLRKTPVGTFKWILRLSNCLLLKSINLSVLVCMFILEVDLCVLCSVGKSADNTSPSFTYAFNVTYLLLLCPW